MGKKIYPGMIDVDHKTIVTIEPTYQDVFLMEDLVHPAASVMVEYFEKGYLRFRVSFKKVISEMNIHDDSCVVDHPEDMYAVRTSYELITGNLKEIGLDGLNTLDIYAVLDGRHLDKNTIISILQKELKLKYYDEQEIDSFLDIHNSGDIPLDGFYELRVE